MNYLIDVSTPTVSSGNYFMWDITIGISPNIALNTNTTPRFSTPDLNSKVGITLVKMDPRKTKTRKQRKVTFEIF